MKWISILTAVVMVVVIAGATLLYLGSNIAVVGTGLTVTAAADQTATFDAIKEQLANDAFIGIVYTDAELGSAEDYQFLTYTVRLKNGTFLTAEQVELQVTPLGADVLQIGDETSYTLPGRDTGDISATILTTTESHPVREMRLTFYVWGLPFTLRTSYGR